MASYEFSMPKPCDIKCLLEIIDALNLSGYGRCHGNSEKIYVIADNDPTYQDLIQEAIDSYDHSSVILNSHISIKCAEIDEKRDSVFYQDFTYNGMVFDGHKQAIENIKEAIEAANSVAIAKLNNPETPDFTANWYIKDNSSYNLTGDDLTAICGLIATRKQNCWDNARTHKDAVESLTDASQVDGYQVHNDPDNNVSGWPI